MKNNYPKDKRILVKDILKEMLSNLLLILASGIFSALFYTGYNYQYNPQYNTYKNLGDCPFDKYITSSYEVRDIQIFRQNYFEGDIREKSLYCFLLISIAFIIIRYTVIFIAWLKGGKINLLMKKNILSLLGIKVNKQIIKYIITTILVGFSGIIFYIIGEKQSDPISKIFCLFIFIGIIYFSSFILLEKERHG